jgi:hypothetical protein
VNTSDSINIVLRDRVSIVVPGVGVDPAAGLRESPVEGVGGLPCGRQVDQPADLRVEVLGAGL